MDFKKLGEFTKDPSKGIIFSIFILMSGSRGP